MFRKLMIIALILLLPSLLLAQQPDRLQRNSSGGYNWYKNNQMIGRSIRNSSGGQNFYDSQRGYTWRSQPSVNGQRIQRVK